RSEATKQSRSRVFGLDCFCAAARRLAMTGPRGHARLRAARFGGLSPPYGPVLVAPRAIWHQGSGFVPHAAVNRSPGAPMDEMQLAARRRINAWLIAFALTIAFCAVSYVWFDRPISFFMHRELGQPVLLTQLPRISEWLVAGASGVFVLLGLRGLTGRPLSRLEAVILLGGLSIIVASAIKGELKFIFGRTWPETWVGNNPSLIRDGVYGFHFFHGGRGYDSFPSGHT